MENQNEMSEYSSIFRFLRLLPIPERLKVNVPGLDILSTKVNLPPMLERSISLKSLFSEDKKSATKKRVQKRAQVVQKAIANGQDIAIQGALGKGFETNFSVAGQDIAISETTWIFGELRLGSTVQVYGPSDHNGVVTALKIVVL